MCDRQPTAGATAKSSAPSPAPPTRDWMAGEDALFHLFQDLTEELTWQDCNKILPIAGWDKVKIKGHVDAYTLLMRAHQNGYLKHDTETYKFIADLLKLIGRFDLVPKVERVEMKHLSATHVLSSAGQSSVARSIPPNVNKQAVQTTGWSPHHPRKVTLVLREFEIKTEESAADGNPPTRICTFCDAPATMLLSCGHPYCQPCALRAKRCAHDDCK